MANPRETCVSCKKKLDGREDAYGTCGNVGCVHKAARHRDDAIFKTAVSSALSPLVSIPSRVAVAYTGRGGNCFAVVAGFDILEFLGPFDSEELALSESERLNRALREEDDGV